MPILKLIHLVFYVLAFSTAQARIWTNLENSKIEAEYISHSQSKVTIKLRKSGKIIKYPINKLSQGDKEFLAELSKTNGLRIVDEIEYKVHLSDRLFLLNCE